MRSRSVGMCIVLSLVTCGLYTLYWLYSLAEDMDHLTGGHSGGSGGMVLLLTIITCGLYGWYWLYRCRRRGWISCATARESAPVIWEFCICCWGFSASGSFPTR